MQDKHPTSGRKASKSTTTKQRRKAKDLRAQISAEDADLLAQLNSLIDDHERRQWTLGDLILVLASHKWTSKKIKTELEIRHKRSYDEGYFSQWRTTAKAFPPDKRNFAHAWHKHLLSRMAAGTFARDRGIEPDYDAALAVIGPSNVKSAKDATKLLRAAFPRTFDLGEPEIREGMDTIICGDSLEETTKIADKVERGELEPFHFILFSPPYFHATLYKEYGENVKRFQTYEHWGEYQHQLAEQFRRLLAPHGCVAINSDDCTIENALKKSLPSPRYPVLADLDFIYRRTLNYAYRDRFMWGKQECVGDHHMIGGPRSPRVNNAYEDIIIFQKSNGPLDAERFTVGDPERKAWLTGGVWSFMPVQSNPTPCPYPYPEEMAFRLISLFTGANQNVLCPFVGSGTDAVVAKKLNRHFIGIDADKTTAAYAQQQVDQTNVGDPIKRSVPTLLGLPVDPQMKLIMEASAKKKGKRS